MKRFAKSTSGVTLLEIMLVLAVAAMIIVMSIRYYQSANNNQQSNAFLQQVQGITATVESLAVGTGNYAGITLASLTAMLPGGATALVAPWGGNLTYAPTANGFTLTAGTPPSVPVCTLVTNQLKTNNHYTVAANCGTITYITNP